MCLTSLSSKLLALHSAVSWKKRTKQHHRDGKLLASPAETSHGAFDGRALFF